MQGLQHTIWKHTDFFFSRQRKKQSTENLQVEQLGQLQAVNFKSGWATPSVVSEVFAISFSSLLLTI